MKGRGSLLLLAVVAVVLLRPWQLQQNHAGPDASGRLSGRVVRAVDGDTLEVRLDDGEIETVRVIGVDTPETVKPDDRLEGCMTMMAARGFRHLPVLDAGKVVGVIGVLGPTRLNYGRIIPMVDHTAKVIGRLLG